MRKAALVVLLLVTAACGDSGSPTSSTVAATSSTTAEEALAVDGPVMRYPSAESPSGDLDTLLQGVLELKGNCLLLARDASADRFPVLWPAGTRWDATNQSVVSPVGEVMPVGGSVTGRGGFFYLSDVHLLAGTAASNLAASCVDNVYQQVAGVKNADTAIGPKGT
jgi:hypothetical protein